jgi:hypothetical protein
MKYFIVSYYQIFNAALKTIVFVNIFSVSSKLEILQPKHRTRPYKLHSK